MLRVVGFERVLEGDAVTIPGELSTGIHRRFSAYQIISRKRRVQGVVNSLYGWTISSIYVIITTSYMAHEPTSTARARRLRERRAKGIVLTAPVEIGAGGIALLVGNGLLKEHETRDRNKVGSACLEALQQ